MIALTVLLLPLLLLGLYAIGIQYERGGPWRILALVAAVALALDVAMNFSYFALVYWDWPNSGEWTFSKRLPRLNRMPGWRGRFSIAITRWLNRLAPSGQHVNPLKEPAP
jgi:hypothetical protein